jgi:uncharacterized membrane protein YphA (DoxX/SURF4 family)
MYGLLLIGLALFVGYFIRAAALSGMLLLVLYYFAYPPFGGSLLGASEGHLFIVNRLFIEAVALLLLLISKERDMGLTGLLHGSANQKK